MAEPLINLLRLRTTPPAIPPGFLERPRLDEKLTTAVSRPLTMLCAGPGHGKTLTLASWLMHRCAEKVAWLTLDETDNDPQAFWSDVLTALTIDRAVPLDSPLRELIPGMRFGVNAPGLISAGLAWHPDPLVLVLDDFQAITDSKVLKSFERLLDHQPPQLHIVLATRADPPIRLQRRRVAGELTDIRADDLALTEMETGKLLADNGIHLTVNQLGALLTRTKGWAAGVRLATFSVEADDVDDVIDRFTSNNGLVAEYLMEELLDRVPPADRQFLLATSVAERITPQLAIALTHQADSRQVLEKLVTQNALVLELAGDSDWFGFHPMLRELLLRRLQMEQPQTVKDLHLRAAQWFAARGDAIPAIRHASHAQDWELVGHLLATIAWPLALTPSGTALAAALEPAMNMAVRSPTVHTLLAAAVYHYQRHDFGSMRQDYTDAEKLIGTVGPSDRTAVESLIGTLRIAHSRIVNPADTENAAAKQLRLLEVTTEQRHPTTEHHRVIATNNLAVGQFWAGRLEDAATNLRAVQLRCRELGIGLTELSVHGHLALLDVVHGRLPAAAERTEGALDLADRRGWTAEPQALGLHVALAMINLERGNFEFAVHTRDEELAAGTDVACRLALAIVAVDQASAVRDGILADQAAVRLEGIALRAGRLPPLLARWCSAGQAAGDLAAGRWSDAIDRVCALDTGFTYPDSLGRVVLAKARLQLDQPQEAVDALYPILSAAPRFRGPAIEARILAAIATERMHRDTAALNFVTEAIGLAHSVGIIRPFLTVGPQVSGLLDRYRHVVARHPDFTGQLTAAITGERFPSPSARPCLETLTGRELTVLAYLPTMLKSAEIAADLFVSVNTVKTHQRAIYRKLGVGNRRGAVDRARALNMLE